MIFVDLFRMMRCNLGLCHEYRKFRWNKIILHNRTLWFPFPQFIEPDARIVQYIICEPNACFRVHYVLNDIKATPRLFCSRKAQKKEPTR